MRPIRFCLLTTFYPPWNFGGDGIHVQRLAHALADRGHRVTVVCSPKVHRILGGEPAGRRDHPGVEVVAIEDGLLSLTGEYLAGRPLRARRQLDSVLERGFDVVHFHNASLLGAPAALAMGGGIKLYTAHEQWLLCPSHLLWKRSGRVCENPPCWGCEVTHGRPPQLWRRTSLLKRSLAHLDALILPSQTSAKLHARFGSLAPLEVINHFAPEQADRKAADLPRVDVDGTRPQRPYFLYAGRLEPIKGVSTLVDAFRRRRSQDLVIAGDGALARRLRRSAAELPHVRFVGWQSREQLASLYRGALAVLTPTLGHEAFPLVPLEAFAQGTPLVARRFGALEEVVGATGAGISFDSPAELDAALQRIASDRGLREELGRRGRSAVADRYSLDAHLRRYLGLIARLARQRGDGDLAATAESAAPEPARAAG